MHGVGAPGRKPSCGADFRISRRYEVPFVHDAVYAGLAAGQHFRESVAKIFPWRPRPVDARPSLAHHFLFVSASTPGNFLPSRNSSDAPPPVEMCVILSATLAA